MNAKNKTKKKLLKCAKNRIGSNRNNEKKK